MEVTVDVPTPAARPVIGEDIPLVIVHEAPVRGGFGGEVAAVVANKAFGYLDAPIQRVGAPWTPIPFSPTLEEAYLPKESDIVTAVRSVVGASAG